MIAEIKKKNNNFKNYFIYFALALILVTVLTCLVSETQITCELQF